MADSRLVTLCDRLIALLEDMGPETGFRLDYARVERVLFPYGIQTMRVVQVGLLGTVEGGAPNTGLGDMVAHDQYRHLDQIAIQVHLEAERRDDGTLDALTPMANCRADIFQALIGQSLGTRHLGDQYCVVHWLASEGEPIYTEEVIGGTVREIYGIEWDHAASGMDVAPT